MAMTPVAPVDGGGGDGDGDGGSDGGGGEEPWTAETTAEIELKSTTVNQMALAMVMACGHGERTIEA